MASANPNLPFIDNRLINQLQSDHSETRRITRLVIEALEVAFFLCNMYFESFTIPKVLDIVEYIMPTAYIVNSGYWAFYSDATGKSICVCNRFNFPCVHLRNINHWINLTNPIQSGITMFSKIPPGKYTPGNSDISVTPKYNDVLRAYDVSIKLVVNLDSYKNVASFAAGPNMFTVCTDFRYLMSPEYKPRENKIIQFTPHPTSNSNYGKYFATLHSYADTLSSWCHCFYQNTLSLAYTPKVTIFPSGTHWDGPSYSNSLGNVRSYHYAQECTIQITGSLCNRSIITYRNLVEYEPVYLIETINRTSVGGRRTDYLAQVSTTVTQFSESTPIQSQTFRRLKQSPSTENDGNQTLPTGTTENSFEEKDINNDIEENCANIATIVIEDNQDNDDYLEDINNIIEREMMESITRADDVQQTSFAFSDDEHKSNA
ncbi:hypothetical protein FQA39_LY01734 [Lamprigera yunnana]|nr:hypothetical protein FQA39_LY01734 [Lamprigera yunnana]